MAAKIPSLPSLKGRIRNVSLNSLTSSMATTGMISMIRLRASGGLGRRSGRSGSPRSWIAPRPRTCSTRSYRQARADRQRDGYGDWGAGARSDRNDILTPAIQGGMMLTRNGLLRPPDGRHRSPQERPPRDQDTRSGLRQRPLPPLRLRTAAGHLRRSLRRPGSGAGVEGRYPSEDNFRRAPPGLILRHNLHGIDIDLRATQIAGFALWLRASAPIKRWV